MWGIFIKRVALHDYQFKTDAEVMHIRLPLVDHVPVLQTVRYLVWTNPDHFSTLIDAERFPWNRMVQQLYYPITPFTPEFPFSVRSPHPEAARWLTFDMDFQIQRLVPGRHVSEFFTYVQQQKFDTLVHAFGGVDPLQLRRFLPMEEGVHPLVYDAFVIQEFTQRMKCLKRVWWGDDLLNGLLTEDETWKEACNRLMQLEVLVHRDGKIGFGWAVTLLDRVKAVLLANNVKVELAPNVVPITLSDSLRGTIRFDPEYSMDRWIDAKQLSVAALDSTWTSTTEFKVYPTFPSIELACDHVRTLYTNGMKTLCISNRGTLSFDRETHTTCLVTGVVDGLGLNEVVVVSQNLNNPATSLVLGKSGNTVAMANSLLFPFIVPFSSRKFSDLATISKKIPLDMLIVFFDTQTDFRWRKEVERFSNATTKARQEYPGVKFRLLMFGRETLTQAKALELMESSRLFQEYLVELLSGKHMPEAYFWECAPIQSKEMAETTPFEFVIMPTSAFERIEKSTPDMFMEYFQSDRKVATFPALTKSTILVSPHPGPEFDAMHLAQFMRTGKESRRELFYRVAIAVKGALAKNPAQPIWLSTSGLGVPWLHVRVDQNPRYYSYTPYKSLPGQV